MQIGQYGKPIFVTHIFKNKNDRYLDPAMVGFMGGGGDPNKGYQNPLEIIHKC